MIVTHCGSAIVAGDEENVGTVLQRLAGKYEVTIEVAYDGMDIAL